MEGWDTVSNMYYHILLIKLHPGIVTTLKQAIQLLEKLNKIDAILK